MKYIDLQFEHLMQDHMPPSDRRQWTDKCNEHNQSEACGLFGCFSLSKPFLNCPTVFHLVFSVLIIHIQIPLLCAYNSKYLPVISFVSPFHSHFNAFVGRVRMHTMPFPTIPSGFRFQRWIHYYQNVYDFLDFLVRGL